MIGTLISLVIYVIIIGLIFWILWWALSQLPIPEPFNTVARVLLALAAVLIVIYLLLGLVPAGNRLHLSSLPTEISHDHA